MFTTRPARHRGVPTRTRHAVMRAVRVGLQGLRAIPHQRMGDWAQEHFVLTSDSSHRTGGWDAWPFQLGILDAMSNDDIEQLDVQKAKRVGYTKMLTASIAYDAAHRPRKQALWQPTDDDRDSFVKSEVDPMLEDGGVKVLRAARRASRGEETIKYKQFRGTVAHFLGGKAARAYRRITVAVAKLDEIDGFDQQIEKSSDPITLARGRLEGAPYPKLICGGTPRLKGLSHVERQVGLADARLRYRISCPHCSAEHPLIWGDKKIAHGFKWDGPDVSTVRHVCPHCHQPIRQADYLRVWKQGAWVCDITGLRYGPDREWRNDLGELVKPPRHIAFTELWTAYSPQRAWTDIVTEFLGAHKALEAGETGPMQGFVNETLARTWEEEYEQTEADLLRRRAKAEAFALGQVPAAASLVLASVDVQGDRWEYGAWAVGRDGETWAIDYRVIHGNPGDLTEWNAKIGPLVEATYRHANGGRVRISAMAVDTGYHTHVAYEFCRLHKSHNVYAVKGDSQPNKPIKAKRSLMDINTRGRVIRKGVALWHVGTDTAKDLLHGRLQLEGRGPGRVHFAADLPDLFFSGITAEMRVPVRTVRGLEFRWECPAGKRNEPLDITVYTLFLAEVLEVSRWTDRQWSRAESALRPDLFDQLEHDDAQASTDEPAAPVIEVPPPPAIEPIKVVAGSMTPPRSVPRPSTIASSDWSSRI